MTISPYDQETRQQAVRLYFEELADGASSKAAALRAVEAVIGIKTSTICNWVRAEEKKWTSPSSNPTPRKTRNLLPCAKKMPGSKKPTRS
ncbi:hypothetical protein CDBH8_2106 [Corynebacterium diphtheriae BH8]|uniref:hypothetical protein n=1 Tax=Corynebacterium diphtheriae TaxID=1717 RepID=UPI000245AD92|nr:hypothetical protein [Corynebacterium diphtheriae]AEX49621.1 hypothetical protein CDBH8_2106 [Corynebacterium diphtheriae BH8]